MKRRKKQAAAVVAKIHVPVVEPVAPTARAQGQIGGASPVTSAMSIGGSAPILGSVVL